MTLLTPPKVRNLRYLCAAATKYGQGSVAEVGVYRGGSAKIILESMLGFHVVYLFDTYMGLPEPEPRDGIALKAGHFKGALDEVQAALADYENVRYEMGLFPDSATGCQHLTFCFVHVDVDLGASVHAACEWFSRRMSPGGIMLFDDFGCPQTPAAKPAVEAFFGERVVDLGTRQAMVQF